MNVGDLIILRVAPLLTRDATRRMKVTELLLCSNSSSVAAAAPSQQQLHRSSSSVAAAAPSQQQLRRSSSSVVAEALSVIILNVCNMMRLIIIFNEVRARV